MTQEIFLDIARVQLERDGTRRLTGREVKG